MPPKFFWDMEGRKCNFIRKYEKGCFFKKITIFRKIIAILVILQNEKRTSTSNWRASSTKEKNNVDYAYYWYKS